MNPEEDGQGYELFEKQHLKIRDFFHVFAVFKYSQLITTITKNPVHNSVTSIWNGGVLLVDHVISNGGNGGVVVELSYNRSFHVYHMK